MFAGIKARSIDLGEKSLPRLDLRPLRLRRYAASSNWSKGKLNRVTSFYENF